MGIQVRRARAQLGYRKRDRMEGRGSWEHQQNSVLPKGVTGSPCYLPLLDQETAREQE